MNKLSVNSGMWGRLAQRGRSGGGVGWRCICCAAPLIARLPLCHWAPFPGPPFGVSRSVPGRLIIGLAPASALVTSARHNRMRGTRARASRYRAQRGLPQLWGVDAGRKSRARTCARVSRRRHVLECARAPRRSWTQCSRTAGMRGRQSCGRADPPGIACGAGVEFCGCVVSSTPAIPRRHRAIQTVWRSQVEA